MEENSDTFVVDALGLGPAFGAPDLVGLPWTERMDAVLSLAASQGVRRADVERAVASVPFSSAIRDVRVPLSPLSRHIPLARSLPSSSLTLALVLPPFLSQVPLPAFRETGKTATERRGEMTHVSFSIKEKWREKASFGTHNFGAGLNPFYQGQEKVSNLLHQLPYPPSSFLMSSGVRFLGFSLVVYVSCDACQTGRIDFEEGTVHPPGMRASEKYYDEPIVRNVRKWGHFLSNLR